MMSARLPRVGFVTEQTLGHVTYAKNLQAAYASCERLVPVWMPVPFASGGPLDRLPVIGGNWALRGSLRAFAAVRSQARIQQLDALFFHTQTVALLAPLAGRGVPVILSLDATPANIDSIAANYGHRVYRHGGVEQAKRALYRRIFNSAAALTTFSQWAKDSLSNDYGVDPDRVTVIFPGVDLALFPFGVALRPAEFGRPVQILFVGGNFERKGGSLLLDTFHSLRLHGRAELHIVTRDAVEPSTGVAIHRDVANNSEQLMRLYQQADVFVLPTLADCSSHACVEAMAAGLPVLATAVGGMPEVVEHGRNGFLVPPGDGQQLAEALRKLVGDSSLRQAMGSEGRKMAEARFNVRVNAERLTDLIEAVIGRPHRSDAANAGTAGSRAG